MTEDPRATLRDILLQNEHEHGNPRYAGKNPDGSGKWLFNTTSLGGITPKQLDALYRMAGLERREIIPLGRCSDCAHSRANGREQGYQGPCLSCSRPRMSNFVRKEAP